MIAIDTNLLVYAHLYASEHNEAAFRLLEGLSRGTRPWAIPWHCLVEFFRVVTDTRLWGSRASKPDAALAQIHTWASSPSVRLLSENAETLAQLSALLHRTQLRGSAVHDARIAAVCLSHGVDELLSADRDYSRFPQLAVRNPLVSK